MGLSEKIRVLFVSENITTSQVVRLVLLAKYLNSDEYEVHFACSFFDEKIFKGTNFQRWIIFTINKQVALANIEKGRRIYTEKVLDEYIKKELDLFQKIKPRLVVGDFRLSLCISTAVANIPFINLINAYWHPNILHKKFPIPDHPLINLLGVRISSLFYPLARSWLFDFFARPVNQLRKKYNLEPIGSLQDILTYGDCVICPDVPELIPVNLPSNHSYIGPLIWSPETEEPPWEIKSDQLIYLTAGSSGSQKIINAVIKALENTSYSLIVSMAGEKHNYKDSDRIKFKDFVDGNKVIEKASLVICNGGSSTAYQSLAQGKPVIGIPSNLDQHLCMKFITQVGAGISLRSDQLSSEKIINTVKALLYEPSFKRQSERLKVAFEAFSPCYEFKKILMKMIH